MMLTMAMMMAMMMMVVVTLVGPDVGEAYGQLVARSLLTITIIIFHIYIITIISHDHRHHKP